ncbi:MAG: cytochrome c biogenesis protein CcdA [Candidatus Bathyarchaeia archaeon]|jgi:cytochrome c biogenesis protein CcdA
MSLLLLAYMSIAFVAGVVALAMPCCFSVLLPSYFAQSFKQKARLIGMTFVFSSGIATIMLPLALGAVALAQTIRASHSLVFVIGGFLMIILGFWTLWGQGMLPRLQLPVNLNKHDVLSVYTLGVFSGAATSCCAPVLAGVLVLSALSAGTIEGLLIGFTYVLGMVFPLFAIALAWDKYAPNGENPLKGRLLHFNTFGREVTIHSSKLISGLMFVTMGIVTVALGLLGEMIPAPGSVQIGVLQAQLAHLLTVYFANSSGLELVGVLGVALILTSVFALRNHIRKPLEPVRIEGE